MSMNGNQSELQSILERARVLHEEKLAEIEQTLELLRQQQSDARHLKGILRAGGMEEEKPKKRASPKGVAKETLTEILDLVRHITNEKPPILADVPRSFTVRMLKEESEMTPTTIRLGLEALRESGAVRLAGMDMSGGGRAAKVYALVIA